MRWDYADIEHEFLAGSVIAASPEDSVAAFDQCDRVFGGLSTVAYPVVPGAVHEGFDAQYGVPRQPISAAALSFCA